MTITKYQPDNYSELSAFFNKNCEYDTFSPDLLKEKLEGDPNWDAALTFACKSEKKIIGFMQGVIREILGTKYAYIKLMAVENTFRHTGIAKKMYIQLENAFRKYGVECVRIYDVPLNYWMPGVDPRYTPAVCFAKRMGFQRNGDTSNLVVDLQHSEWKTQIEEKNLKLQGIEIQRAMPEDQSGLLTFIEKEWPLWKHEVERCFDDQPPSVHFARMNGKILAFAAHNGNNKGTGWFGPMATHPELRGKGIGGILLKRCLRDMRQEGLPNAIIPWVGPIPFYAFHANAKVDRVFWRYEKKLI